MTHADIITDTDSAPIFPQVHYDRDGDCLEVVLSGRSYFGRPAGPRLTLYLDQETEAVVGLMVEGISDLMRPAMEAVE